MEKVWKSWILVYLIGGFNPSEKNISQLGLFFPIITWKVIKFMFQTTNQLWMFTMTREHVRASLVARLGGSKVPRPELCWGLEATKTDVLCPPAIKRGHGKSTIYRDFRSKTSILWLIGMIDPHVIMAWINHSNGHGNPIYSNRDL